MFCTSCSAHLVKVWLSLRLSTLLQNVESSKTEMVELCSELVRIPTPNPAGDTDQCVKFIEDYFAQQGVPTEVHSRHRGKANIVAKIEGVDPNKVLWLGHIDVVPEGDPLSWKHEPYGGKIEGNAVYGRGSSDMKGSCAAAMVAAKALHSIGKPPVTMEFWFTCDEETQGEDGAQWLAQEGKIKGDVCIIGDSSGSTLSRPYVDLGCKGFIWTKLKARGRTAHGSTPYLGDNALEKLLRVISRIQKISNQRLVIPADLNPALRSSVDFLLSSEKLTQEQRRAVKRVYEHPTFSLNMLKGGVKVNVVPDAAEASIDIRFTPGIDFDRIREQIQSSIQEAGVEGVTAEYQIGTGYYESSRSLFASQLRRAVSKVTGHSPRFKILTGGTDAILLKNIQGIPCLGFGAGLEGMAHAPDEYISMEQLTMAAKVYAVFPFVYKG